MSKPAYKIQDKEGNVFTFRKYNEDYEPLYKDENGKQKEIPHWKLDEYTVVEELSPKQKKELKIRELRDIFHKVYILKGIKTYHLDSRDCVTIETNEGTKFKLKIIEMEEPLVF